jgi:hypothetical protein
VARAFASFKLLGERTSSPSSSPNSLPLFLRPARYPHCPHSPPPPLHAGPLMSGVVGLRMVAPPPPPGGVRESEREVARGRATTSNVM